jgi:hypothetical protein
LVFWFLVQREVDVAPCRIFGCHRCPRGSNCSLFYLVKSLADVGRDSFGIRFGEADGAREA